MMSQEDQKFCFGIMTAIQRHAESHKISIVEACQDFQSGVFGLKVQKDNGETVEFPIREAAAIAKLKVVSAPYSEGH